MARAGWESVRPSHADVHAVGQPRPPVAATNPPPPRSRYDGGARTVEAWLRDFQESIYGRELALRDLRYVREQRHFAEVSELVRQMQLDLQAIGYPAYG